MRNLQKERDELEKAVLKLPEKLWAKKSFSLSMIIGIDGFVDEIIHVVDKRQDFQNYTRIKTIADFGARISNATGLSTNIEMVTVDAKLGGNGPILTNALLEYGADVTYIGALGKPDIHPVFKSMAKRAKAVHSFSALGHSDACEFEDGKIMLGKHSSLKEITWEAVKSALDGAEGISKLIQDCQLFGMENWTMIPYMSEIWEGIIDEVFPLLPHIQKNEEKPLAFFDLADPEKRTREDIIRAMTLISKFEEKFRVILGLNEKEVYEIANALEIGIKPHDSEQMLKSAIMETHKNLGIYCLMAHPVKSACCAIGGEYYAIEGSYCQQPKLTTGAGDNLNAGFCIGMSLGLDATSCLVLGVCTSGYYVRNAKSPSFEQVIEFARQWGNGYLT